MMPVIRITDPIFERLQSLAKPFVDTPATVIERLLDSYESRVPNETKIINKPALPGLENPFKSFDPYDPPDLTHTRVVKGEVGGQGASSWNELLQMAHRDAASKVEHLEELRTATLSNIVFGRKTDNGFHYMSDIKISLQNVEANRAWKNTFHLAKRLNLDVSVDFEWRHNNGAAMPGKFGRLVWPQARAK